MNTYVYHIYIQLLERGTDDYYWERPYVYIWCYVFFWTCMCMHLHINLCVYICLYICIHIYMYIHICIFKYIHTHLYMYIDIFIYIYGYDFCLYECINLLIYINMYMHNLSFHICIYVYTYVYEFILIIYLRYEICVSLIYAHILIFVFPPLQGLWFIRIWALWPAVRPSPPETRTLWWKGTAQTDMNNFTCYFIFFIFPVWHIYLCNNSNWSLQHTWDCL
jgi:hypothetical protein